MTEIEDVINSRSLTEQSKRTYRNNYSRITAILNKQLKDADQELIIFVITELSNGSINNELTYLNIPIMVKQFYGKPTDKLNSRREQLFTLREKQQKKSVELDLPTYTDVKTYVNNLTGVKYIVNYLLLMYGVRNKDVNVFVTTRGDTKNIDTNLNYLLVKGREIEWIRNDYKTSTTYGQQRITIKAKKFIEEVKALPLNTFILSGTQQPIAESSLSNIISRMLYNHKGRNLTEGDYFKINVLHLQTQPNSYSKIIALGDIRGTSAETIEQYYNIKK